MNEEIAQLRDWIEEEFGKLKGWVMEQFSKVEGRLGSLEEEVKELREDVKRLDGNVDALVTIHRRDFLDFYKKSMGIASNPEEEKRYLLQRLE